jgi:hypothetical protein
MLIWLMSMGVGVLEYRVLGTSLHYSISPTLQLFRSYRVARSSVTHESFALNCVCHCSMGRTAPSMGPA